MKQRWRLKVNSYHKGRLAEILAHFFVRICGYRIVAENYVTGRGSRAGEIDFVAVKKRHIYFFEVKQRSNLTAAAYAVSDRQKGRIVRGAEGFLQKNPSYKDYEVHFSAVLVSLPLSVKVIVDAWRL
ncbi:MAG: YraN family protein [Alphaproteobacteria bacterium]|nr:YraN family protein [Alphaproteobacteria bacterium]